MRHLFRLGRLVPCCLLLLPCFGLERTAFGLRAPDTATVATSTFRINGVVVSSRDGSPLARCKLTVSPVGNAVSASPGRMNRFDARPAFGGGPGGRGPGFQRGGDAPMRPGRERGTDSAAADSVITDAQGRFTLAVPHAGMWRLVGTAHGFRQQAYDEHEGYSSAVVLTALAPEVVLTFHMQPDAVITGLVFDEAGEPVRQAQVRASAVEPGKVSVQGQIVGFTQTDDRGRYEIVGLAPGKYHVGVQAQPWYADGGGRPGGFRVGVLSAAGAAASSPDPSLDLVYAPTWFPAATDETAAETLDLKAGEERQADVHLMPVPAVHLIVPRNDGSTAPVQGRPGQVPMISSSASFGGFIGPQRITTGANQWELGGLAPGTYQLRVPGVAGQPASEVQVKIAAGSATTIGLDQATPSTKLSVLIDGVAERTVQTVVFTDTSLGQVFPLTFRRGGRGQRGQDDEDDDSDEQTTARTILLPSGTYEISLSGDDGVFMTGLKAAGARAIGKSVEVNGGTPILTLHAATGRAEVRGIVSRDKKACAGAMVLLVPTTFGQTNNIAEVVRDQTNTDGSFVLKDVIPGEYLLVAIDHGWEVNWHDPATLARYLLKATPLPLKSSAHVRQDIEATAP